MADMAKMWINVPTVNLYWVRFTVSNYKSFVNMPEESDIEKLERSSFLDFNYSSLVFTTLHMNTYDI